MGSPVGAFLNVILLFGRGSSIRKSSRNCRFCPIGFPTLSLATHAVVTAAAPSNRVLVLELVALASSISVERGSLGTPVIAGVASRLHRNYDEGKGIGSPLLSSN